MYERGKPEESNYDTPVERRSRPRGAVDLMDWETKVVARIGRHVDLLLADSNSQVDTLSQLGWEQASLLALRRRMRDRKSD